MSATSIILLLLSGCRNTGEEAADKTNKHLTQIQISKEIATAIEQSTVLITRGSLTGSGVIIAKQSDIYYVLTAKHVVDQVPNQIQIDLGELTQEQREKLGDCVTLNPSKTIECDEGNYTITTFDQVKYSLDYKTVEKIADFDLALLEFKSSLTYPVATLINDKPKASFRAYLSGYKKCTTGPKYDITEGIVENDFQKNVISSYIRNFFVGKYNIYYTNPTLPGMSGGGIFSERGELLAIHGRTDSDKNRSGYDLTLCQKLGTMANNPGLGRNWGTSIRVFLESESAKRIKENLALAQEKDRQIGSKKSDKKEQLTQEDNRLIPIFQSAECKNKLFMNSRCENPR